MTNFEDTRSRIREQLNQRHVENKAQLLVALAITDVAEILAEETTTEKRKNNFPFSYDIIEEDMDDDRPAPGLHQE